MFPQSVHLHNAVHFKPFFWHEHLDVPWQIPLQPHFTSSRTASGAGLSRHLMGDSMPFAFSSHPFSKSGGSFGFGSLYDLSLFEMKLDRWMCGFSVPSVGGSFSPSRFLVLKSSQRRSARVHTHCLQNTLYKQTSQCAWCHSQLDLLSYQIFESFWPHHHQISGIRTSRSSFFRNIKTKSTPICTCEVVKPN